MAVPATTSQTERLMEQWKCTACAEIWEFAQRDGVKKGCPECRGPLRLISSSPLHQDHPVTRTLLAISDDQQWLVVHQPDLPTPWTVLRRLDEGDGFGATGAGYEDTGQSATDVLATFLTTSRARRLIPLEHTAAD